MEPHQLADRLDAVQVVDVRYPNEWAAGRIEGAQHVPVDDLADRADELDRGRPVVTVCRSGERSGWAAGWLRDEGFDAENLEGGMLAWAAAGLVYRADGGGPGEVAEPEPPADDRPPEMQQLQDDLLSLIFAVSERFGEREPSEAELRAFLRDRLLAEGRTPEEAEAVLARMDADPS